MTQGWKSELGLFLYAMQFLTRLPAPAWVGHDADRLDRSVRYFPVVGAGIGALCGLGFIGLSLILPPLAAACGAVAMGVLMTGAFHEDGLADTWDGIGGGVTRERALEIMRDSRLGTYGAAALGFSLLMRVALLSSMDPVTGCLALIAVHAGARTWVCAVIRFCTYARSDGLAKPVADRLRPGEWPLALMAGILAVLPLGGAGVVALLAGIAATLAMVGLLTRKLGGYTGDGLGAIEQSVEITMMIVIVAWLG